jgi:hypothetical protein
VESVFDTLTMEKIICLSSDIKMGFFEVANV